MKRDRAVRGVLAVATIAALALAVGCSSSSSSKPAGSGVSAESSGVKTLKSGTLTVGLFAGYLPYVDVQNGACVGIDCDIIQKIANQLGLKLSLQVMSFAAELEAVQQGRVDVGIGEVSWTAKRAQVGTLTDPVYYSSAALIQPAGSKITTMSQMKGLQVGTLVGYNWIQALQKLPGVTVKTYQTADAVYSDISNGRLQTGIIDAAADQYVKKIQPSLKFDSLPIQVTDADLAEQPDDATFLQNQQVFFLGKNGAALATAMNGVIAKMHAAKQVTDILKKYGISDPSPFLVPQSISSTNRQGVDRPKDWKAPTEGN